MDQIKNDLMNDAARLKYQEKLLKERIDLANTQHVICDNLKRTKARSNFIRKENLKLNIYKFTPKEHLELVPEGAKTQYGNQYEEFKKKEAEMLQKAEEERKAKELAAKKNKPL